MAVFKVKKGDTLESIAARAGVSVREAYRYFGGKPRKGQKYNTKRLQSMKRGQGIAYAQAAGDVSLTGAPGGMTWNDVKAGITVQPNDTFSTIAEREDIPLKDLLDANQNVNTLHPGALLASPTSPIMDGRPTSEADRTQYRPTAAHATEYRPQSSFESQFGTGLAGTVQKTIASNPALNALYGQGGALNKMFNVGYQDTKKLLGSPPIQTMYGPGGIGEQIAEKILPGTTQNMPTASANFLTPKQAPKSTPSANQYAQKDQAQKYAEMQTTQLKRYAHQEPSLDVFTNNEIMLQVELTGIDPTMAGYMQLPDGTWVGPALQEIASTSFPSIANTGWSASNYRYSSSYVKNANRARGNSSYSGYSGNNYYDPGRAAIHWRGGGFFL